MVTKEEFHNFTPRARGFAVYWLGAKDDEPNVPAENNPYPVDSVDYNSWNEGQLEAVLQVIEGEDKNV